MLVLAFLGSAMFFSTRNIIIWFLCTNSVDKSVKFGLCQNDFKHFIIFNYSLCMYVCVCVCVCVCVGLVRSEGNLREIRFFCFISWTQGSNWDCQAWQQVPLSTMPLCPIRNKLSKLLKNNIRELRQRNCLGLKLGGRVLACHLQGYGLTSRT